MNHCHIIIGFVGCMLFLYGDPSNKSFNCTDRNLYASSYRQILHNLLSAVCSVHFSLNDAPVALPYNSCDRLMCTVQDQKNKPLHISTAFSLTYITCMFGQCCRFSPQRSLMLFQRLAKEGRYKRVTLAGRLGCNHNYSTAELIKKSQIGLFECL